MSRVVLSPFICSSAILAAIPDSETPAFNFVKPSTPCCAKTVIAFAPRVPNISKASVPSLTTFGILAIISSIEVILGLKSSIVNPATSTAALNSFEGEIKPSIKRLNAVP